MGTFATECMWARGQLVGVGSFLLPVGPGDGFELQLSCVVASFLSPQSQVSVLTSRFFFVCLFILQYHLSLLPQERPG